MQTYSIGGVARFSGMTVRALHHYDRIGLLKPVQSHGNGYRFYDERHLERLHRILFYRDLGFPLADIAAVLESGSDEGEHLRRQQRLLQDKMRQLERLSTTLQRKLEAHALGIKLNPDELFEVFGEDDPTRHATEVERKWGDSQAFRQSQERAKTYSKERWKHIKAEGDAIQERSAQALRAGLLPQSQEAREAAEAHRQHLCRWHYDCSPEMHRNLGEMFAADPRFGASYDALAPGLAEFVLDSIRANADHRPGI